MIKIIIVLLLLVIIIILYKIIKNKKEKFTKESIINLSSILSLNSINNKIYDEQNSTYIIYEDKDKAINNACVGNICLDFNEFNKLKNINNKILYDISKNEINGNIIINRETIDSTYNNILKNKSDLVNKYYLYNQDYKIYRINQNTDYNNYINKYNNISNYNSTTIKDDDINGEVFWINCNNIDNSINLQLEPNGSYYNFNKSFIWIPIYFFKINKFLLNKLLTPIVGVSNSIPLIINSFAITKNVYNHTKLNIYDKINVLSSFLRQSVGINTTIIPDFRTDEQNLILDFITKLVTNNNNIDIILSNANTIDISDIPIINNNRDKLMYIIFDNKIDGLNYNIKLNNKELQKLQKIPINIIPTYMTQIPNIYCTYIKRNLLTLNNSIYITHKENPIIKIIEIGFFDYYNYEIQES